MSDTHTEALLLHDCEGTSDDKQWLDEENNAVRCGESAAEKEVWCLYCHAVAILDERNQLRLQRDALKNELKGEYTKALEGVTREIVRGRIQQVLQKEVPVEINARMLAENEGLKKDLAIARQNQMPALSSVSAQCRGDKPTMYEVLTAKAEGLESNKVELERLLSNVVAGADAPYEVLREQSIRAARAYFNDQEPKT